MAADAVAALHARYMARVTAVADAAVTAAAAPQLKGATVDFLLQLARLRVTDYGPEKLTALVARAARLSNAARVFANERAAVTREVETRERKLSEAYGAADVSQEMLQECEAASRDDKIDSRIALAFGETDRIYLSIGTGEKKGREKVQAALAVMPPLRPGQAPGYSISDWSAGYATDATGKQTLRIGKLLREYAPDLLPAFENRTTDNLLVVISRKPEDVLRASTNRAWHSCAGAGGWGAYRKIPDSIRAGRLIAYLISARDPDIHDPLARMMIEPYERRTNRDSRADKIGRGVVNAFRRVAGRAPVMPAARVWHPGKNYGIRNADFAAVVARFVTTQLNPGADGYYRLDPAVYNDGYTVLKCRNGKTAWAT